MMKRSFAAAALVVAALPFVVHAQQKEIKIGVIYDYTGAVRRRRLGGRRDRHQDRHRHAQRTRRRRGLQDQRPLRRRAVEGRGGDQRGHAAPRPGEGQPHHGRLLERALRADGAAGRRGEEVHVGERLRRLQRVQGQEAFLRVPAAGALRPVRRGLLQLRRRERQGEAEDRSRRTSASRSSTRTGRMAPAWRRATRRSARSSA